MWAELQLSSGDSSLHSTAGGRDNAHRVVLCPLIPCQVVFRQAQQELAARAAGLARRTEALCTWEQALRYGTVGLTKTHLGNHALAVTL
jgi:hypothetical protein